MTRNQRKLKAPSIATDEPQRAALRGKIAAVEAIKQAHLQRLLMMEGTSPPERDDLAVINARTVVKLAEYVSARLRARLGE